MSTRGYSAVIDGAGGGAPVPIAGDFDIYLDVAAGLDTNGGTGWADAFLTWEKAMDVAEQQVATNPSTEVITIYVENSTVAALAPRGFTIAPNLPDRVRLNVVYPFTRWTELAVGTVGAAGITAEAGDTLANVVIVGFVVNANDRGKTLRLARPDPDANLGEILNATIVGIGPGNSYTITTADAGVIPAFWDADAFTIARLIEAPSVMNGTLVFAPKCGVQAEAALVAAKNWLVGIRANSIIANGDQVAMAGCECRTAAAVTPDGPLLDYSSQGTEMRYIGAVLGGIRAGISDVHARDYAMFGTTWVAGICIGNSCQSLTALGGPEGAFSGYVMNRLNVGRNGSLVASRFRSEDVQARDGAQAELQFFRVLGVAQGACVEADGEGTSITYHDGYLEELAGGPAYICLSNDGAMIIAQDNDLVISTANPANFPRLGWFADAARMDLKAGVLDTQSAKIQGTMLWSVNEADFEVGAAINMVTARPGVAAASDIVVSDCSRMTVDGNILKTAPNTIPCRCLDVTHLSNFHQKTGAFTHGAAPADWAVDYLSGLLYADRGSNIDIGVLSDGAGGGGNNTVAVTARVFSSITCAANSALTNAQVKVGTKAAAAFPAAMLNDLPAGAGGVAGTEELCVVGVRP